MHDRWHSLSIEQLRIARDSLKNVHEVFSQDGKWTQGAFHRNAAGFSCPGSAAVCHCTVGALNVIAPLGYSGLAYDAIVAGNPAIFNEGGYQFNEDGYQGIAEWNDAEGRVISEVLAAIFNGIMFVDAVIQKRVAEFEGSALA